MFSNEYQYGFKTLSNKNSFSIQEDAGIKSRLFLYLAIFLMIVGFIAMFLDSLNIFTPIGQIGKTHTIANWIFSLGIIIDFFCVPILYWSSFYKFKRGDDFWESESFWIVVLFFFGSFFQYTSGLPYMESFLSFSLFLILFVHTWMMVLSKKLIVTNEQFENSVGYFRNLVCIIAYYLILVIAVIFFDLFDKFEYLIS